MKRKKERKSSHLQSPPAVAESDEHLLDGPELRLERPLEIEQVQSLGVEEIVRPVSRLLAPEAEGRREWASKASRSKGVGVVGASGMRAFWSCQVRQGGQASGGAGVRGFESYPVRPGVKASGVAGVRGLRAFGMRVSRGEDIS